MSEKFLLVGLPADRTFSHTVARAVAMGATFDTLNLDTFYRQGRFVGRRGAGPMLIAHENTLICIDDYNSCYLRLIDVSSAEPDIALKRTIHSKHGALVACFNFLPLKVINRPSAGGSNASKPYQSAYLRSLGFNTPAGLATNSPRDALMFIERWGGAVVYKSNSSIRSIVTLLNMGDLDRLDSITGCPVFFQQHIRGPDVRVHVVGELLFAEEIVSKSVDYRYAKKGENSFRCVKLPPELARACVTACQTLGLEFAGIDFKISAADGKYYVLEINPMPGYEGYDYRSEFAISKALIGLLASQTRAAQRDKGLGYLR